MTRESRPFSICYLQGTGVEMSTKTITLWGVNCCGATFLKKKKAIDVNVRPPLVQLKCFSSSSARIENKRELSLLIIIA